MDGLCQELYHSDNRKWNPISLVFRLAKVTLFFKYDIGYVKKGIGNLSHRLTTM